MEAICYVRQDGNVHTAVTVDHRTWTQSTVSSDAALEALGVKLFGAAGARRRHGVFQSRGQLCDRWVITAPRENRSPV